MGLCGVVAGRRFQGSIFLSPVLLWWMDVSNIGSGQRGVAFCLADGIYDILLLLHLEV